MNVDFNQLVLLGIAIASMMQAYFAWQTRKDISGQSETIALLEKNTNSIKDALVATTAEASEARGRDMQRIVGEAKASAVLQGRNEAKLESKGSPGGTVPVSDARTAKAAESTAESTAKLADATVKIADATEKKK